MPPFERWCRWLFVASCAFALLGLVIAVLGARVLPPWEAAIADAFFDGAVPPRAQALQDFLLAPLGGTMAGSYVLQAMVIRYAFSRRERWAWHATLWSMLLWFVIDSSMSLAHGAAFNVYMINITPLVVFGPPLWATRSAFRGAAVAPPGDRSSAIVA